MLEQPHWSCRAAQVVRAAGPMTTGPEAQVCDSGDEASASPCVPPPALALLSASPWLNTHARATPPPPPPAPPRPRATRPPPRLCWTATTACCRWSHASHCCAACATLRLHPTSCEPILRHAARPSRRPSPCTAPFQRPSTPAAALGAAAAAAVAGPAAAAALRRRPVRCACLRSGPTGWSCRGAWEARALPWGDPGDARQAWPPLLVHAHVCNLSHTPPPPPLPLHASLQLARQPAAARAGAGRRACPHNRPAALAGL
jgi:hypothetical protein